MTATTTEQPTHTRTQLDGALGQTRGRQWRSLDELANTEQFQKLVAQEFPHAAGEWNDGPSRRNFLKLMAASLALGGVGVGGAGCFKKPKEEIVPYVVQPEQLTLGQALYYATAQLHGGYARGTIVEQWQGRPIKVDGNPDHPASLGGSDVWLQASLLTMYDPDRSQTVMQAGRTVDWTHFGTAITADLDKVKQNGGSGFRILTETVTSPTLAAQIRSLLKAYPQARWHQYDPIGRDAAKAAARQVFGRAVQPVYDFSKAAVVVSLDSDFLLTEPGHLRYSRQFSDRRRVREARKEMNRLYVAEATPTITGAVADDRVRVKPTEVIAIARAIAARVGGQGGGGDVSGAVVGFVEAIVKDLTAHRGTSLVIAGDGQPPAVHAVAHAINAALGNVGQTVRFVEPVEFGQADGELVEQTASLRQLVDDMDRGNVELLVMIGGNPVYNAPVDFEFAKKLEKVRVRAHYSQYYDETSFNCHWHLPASHELEHWSDARAFDGTTTIIQPLIQPLYATRSAHELISILAGKPDRGGYEIIREYWAGQDLAGGDFDQWWVKTLNDGFVGGSAAKPVAVTPNAAALGTLTAATTQPAAAGGLEVVFRPDPTVYDGSYANNGWLQELPKPLTKLTWDNVFLISRRTAEDPSVGIRFQDAAGNSAKVRLATLTVNGRSVTGPVYIMPGHPDGVVTVQLGYGRTRAGRVGTGIGYDAYAIRTSDALWYATGAQLVPTGETTALSVTQSHTGMQTHGRDLVKVIALGAGTTHAATHGGQGGAPGHTPGGAAGGDNAAGREGSPHGVAGGEHRKVNLSLYPEYDYSQYNKWGMVIDQNACIGCNACVVSCQAENNIPIVGKPEVAKGREMHWLRIDAYYQTKDMTYYGQAAGDDPEGPFFQPLPCMHCEKAPCELVCPVAATVHDHEGLNNMIYNRCVGTRYCSNNCPYKVRRFNFLHYAGTIDGPLKLMQNPDVTVRSRGVMEKCTYCVQRISHARIEYKKRDVAAREATDPAQADRLRNEANGWIRSVTTACQDACPTHAIVFGDLNDPRQEVTALFNEPANYALLEELQTQPRTTYLPRYTNSNPALARAAAAPADAKGAH
ncbi:MAG TPA: TAT-variant-translocated molybdopterin oxidoreductase [Tepidisphaeraceae bacterium]|nr:TAT-variant-translocated molybdopterin oxidoreductase [Tepidisphaeraceae bacterium]